MSEMIEYRGYTAEHNRRVIEKKVNGEWIPVRDRTDLHKLTQQFNWGPLSDQGGLRTSLALLCDLTNDDQLSLRLMRIFKRRVLPSYTPEWRTNQECLMRFVEKFIRVTSAKSAD